MLSSGPNFSKKKKKKKTADAATKDKKHNKRLAERIPLFLSFGQVETVSEYSYRKDS